MSLHSNPEIVRRADGSIDTDHYARRAVVLRQAARTKFRQSLEAFLSGAVSRIGEACSRRIAQLAERRDRGARSPGETAR